MNKDLRGVATEAAAARYGAEHYRGILFWQTFRHVWPVLVLVGIVWGLWWFGTRLSTPSGPVVGFGVAGLAVLAAVFLGVRRLRSPYRRRRYRL